MRDTHTACYFCRLSRVTSQRPRICEEVRKDLPPRRPVFLRRSASAPPLRLSAAPDHAYRSRRRICCSLSQAAPGSLWSLRSPASLTYIPGWVPPLTAVMEGSTVVIFAATGNNFSGPGSSYDVDNLVRLCPSFAPSFAFEFFSAISFAHGAGEHWGVLRVAVVVCLTPRLCGGRARAGSRRRGGGREGLGRPKVRSLLLRCRHRSAQRAPSACGWLMINSACHNQQ